MALQTPTYLCYILLTPYTSVKTQLNAYQGSQSRKEIQIMCSLATFIFSNLYFVKNKTSTYS